MSYWKFFKNNYLYVVLLIMLLSISGIFVVESHAVFVPIILLVIGVVFIPLWGYYKFKKRNV